MDVKNGQQSNPHEQIDLHTAVSTINIRKSSTNSSLKLPITRVLLDFALLALAGKKLQFF